MECRDTERGDQSSGLGLGDAPAGDRFSKAAMHTVVTQQHFTLHNTAGLTKL